MVYCRICRHVFPEYKEVGQAIRDLYPTRFLMHAEDAASAAIKITLTGTLSSFYNGDLVLKIVEEISVGKKILTGSRRDALNAVHFPCPICGESNWRKGDDDKGSVIRPGDPDWRGGPNRRLLG
jgi:hypothetical protein